MTWMDGGNAQNIRIGVGIQAGDPPVDTIQEIKVLANSYRAESRRIGRRCDHSDHEIRNQSTPWQRL